MVLLALGLCQQKPEYCEGFPDPAVPLGRAAVAYRAVTRRVKLRCPRCTSYPEGVVVPLHRELDAAVDKR